MINKMCEAISTLTHAIRGFSEVLENESKWRKSHEGFATKQDLEKMKDQIMSAISVFADKQNAFNARMDVAVAGLVGDVQTLNDKITALQNSPGEITPEDQALLDGIQTHSEAIAVKLEALDALTPPVPPVAAV